MSTTFTPNALTQEMQVSMMSGNRTSDVPFSCRNKLSVFGYCEEVPIMQSLLAATLGVLWSNARELHRENGVDCDQHTEKLRPLKNI